jgi:UDP-hydrolysing UDP-N-acetyl-D-glucosamine 2-epimerase
MKILAFTGSRADYYLQRPLFLLLNESKHIELHVIVTGGILDDSDTSAIDQIHQDNLNITCIQPPNFSTISHLEHISHLINSIPPVVYAFMPDLCLVYADRYESYAFAISCFHLDRLLLHIEAGDITYGGTYDDSVRHSITHICHLFSTTNQKSSDILLSFGIEQWRIHRTGLLGYCNLKSLPLVDPISVLSELKLDSSRPLILATYHPIPRNETQTSFESSEFFSALSQLSTDFNIIITAPNHDSGRNIILDFIQPLRSLPNICFVKSLGALKYYSLMTFNNFGIPAIVAGNSSSVIKEAPFFKAHSVNVGARQTGRVKASTQIDTTANQHMIVSAIRSLYNKPISYVDNPYYASDSALNLTKYILDLFARYDISTLLDRRLFKQ